MRDNWQFAVTLAAIIIGVFYNNQQILKLREEMVSLRPDIHKEFREFYRTIGQHDVRIEHLEKHNT